MSDTETIDTAARVERGMPAALYHSLPGASASRLADFKRCPAYAFYRMTHPSEPTPQMVLGTATHTLTLEPDKFDAEFTVSGQCTGTTKQGKRCSIGGTVLRGSDWFCKTHDPGGYGTSTKTVLTAEQLTNARGMSESIRNHPAARRMLDAATDRELSIFWTDAETGVQRKMRTDLYCGGLALSGDIKTTSDASSEGFQRSLFKYNYAHQAAGYIDGMEAAPLPVDAFNFIVAESKPPFLVAVYAIDDESIALARDEVRRLLRRWKVCEASNVWPGLPLDVQNIGLSKWDRIRLMADDEDEYEF